MNAVTISIFEDLEEIRRTLHQLIDQSEKFCYVAGYNKGEWAERKSLFNHTEAINKAFPLS